MYVQVCVSAANIPVILGKVFVLAYGPERWEHLFDVS